jgi:hypothetical protein
MSFASEFLERLHVERRSAVRRQGSGVLESATGRDGTTQAFHQKAQTAMSTCVVPVFFTQKWSSRSDGLPWTTKLVFVISAEALTPALTTGHAWRL